MNKVMLCGSAVLSALVAPASAQAAVILTTGAIADIAPNNDFQSQLAALGLTRYTTSGAQLVLDSTSIITFEFLGSESGLDDTFTAIGDESLTVTEMSGYTDNFDTPEFIGSSLFAAGDLAGRLLFSSSDPSSLPATVGQQRFSIFLPADQGNGSLTTFYVGFDDLITGDDDYDDFLVRATITPASVVPEPATWAMMIVGFGLIGAAVRSGGRRRNPGLSFA